MQRLAYGLIAAGIVVGAAAGFMLLRGPASAPPPSRMASAEQQPSARKPTQAEVERYTVAPDLPKYLSVPALGITRTRIMSLGIGRANAIAAPDNVYDVGWYKASAKPGQPGATFVYGHLSSWQANGVFHDLHRLKPGDRITIIRGDDAAFTYEVVSSRTYQHDAVDMQAVLSPVAGATSGLNLMTCAGHVIKGTSEFTERLVVFARQVPTP